jgi:hypothetical protein
MMYWRSEKFLKGFYEETVFQLPFDSHFRNFQFRFDDKTILPLRKTIRTPRDLQKAALKKLPIAIYCTRSLFSQAKNLRARGNGLANNLFLAGDVVLDLDDRDFKSPEDCLNMARLMRGVLLQKFPSSPSWTVHSGRGWHIWMFDAFLAFDPLADPRQNETAFRIFLSKLLKELRVFGLSMGKQASEEQVRTFLNTRQVFRVPGSINHNNGKVCRVVPSLSVRPFEKNSIGGHLPFGRSSSLELAEMRAMMKAPPRETKPEGMLN